jgi:phosphatidylserine/phosphatidylglycerophosphate/cardiolipin synthase-like enzyme
MHSKYIVRDDGGQMDPIVRNDWKPNPHAATVLAHWRTVAAHLVRKNSTPYTPTSVHDFMHLKVLITDDTLTTGSYNFSGNAERNAENQIHLDDPDTVAAYADYLATVVSTYSSP